MRLRTKFELDYSKFAQVSQFRGNFPEIKNPTKFERCN